MCIVYPYDKAAAAGFLAQLANTEECREYVVCSGAVPVLCDLLACESPSAQASAARCLHLIAQSMEPRKKMVKEIHWRKVVAAVNPPFDKAKMAGELSVQKIRRVEVASMLHLLMVRRCGLISG